MRDYLSFPHPLLSVPCPACSALVGEVCLRPSGRRAPTMHIARRRLVELMVLVDYGDGARLALTNEGWSIVNADRRTLAGPQSPD